MKSFNPYYLTVGISLLLILGCSLEEDSLTETKLADGSPISYLSKSTTDRVTKDLIVKADEFLLTLDISALKKSKSFSSNKEAVGPYDPEDPTGPTAPPDQTTILRYELTKYWIENKDVLVRLSNELGLEKAITVEQMVDYSESLYFSIADPTRNENMVQLIKEHPFFNDIQKKYAIELWNASNSNDINGLVEIIERLSKDVKIYPELEIFNFAISAIDLLIKVPQDINSSQQRCPWYNFSCNGKLTNGDKNNCRKAAETSGVVGGVFGMVRGAVVGGITGSVLGLNPGTGGAGAVIGATVGGVAGFVEGVVFGYIGCKIFGS